MRGNHWPTGDQELLLEAALLGGAAGAAAWGRAAATIDLDHLVEPSRGLLPLVYEHVAPLDPTSPRVSALEEQYKVTWRQNQQLIAHVHPVLEALARSGIDAIVLKGMALVARYYRDAGLRPMADVDILVPPATVEQASAVLQRLGWRPWYRVTGAFRCVKHAAPFDNGRGGTCDLHWRVLEEPDDRGADDEMRAAAVTIDFQGMRWRILSPTDQLLHVCAHAARWARVPAIRWVADAMRILREEPIAWQRLLAQAVQRRFVLRIREMLVYLQATFRAPVPAAVIAQLAQCPVSRLERFEYRVRSRGHPVLGELPTYVCHCLRMDRRLIRAFPGYLQQAWGLDSLREVPHYAMTRVIHRVQRAWSGGRR